MRRSVRSRPFRARPFRLHRPALTPARRVGPLAFVFALALAAAGAGCGDLMTKITADTTAPVLKAAAPAFQQEPDVQFAREAAPGQLKTVEGFLLATPENRTILEILARGYCEYAFGFLEGDLEVARDAGDYDRADVLTRRATGFYLRCMNYGLKLLFEYDDWEPALHGPLPAFLDKLRDADEEDVPGLFWTALGLGSAININRDDIELVTFLPKARAMFERVVELAPGYHHGTAQMALGMIACAQGRDIGGDPAKGKKHFERAIAVTKGRFLMPRVMLAATCAVVTNDVKLYRRTLVEVLQTSPAAMPELRLANELAHLRARRYLAQEKELF